VCHEVRNLSLISEEIHWQEGKLAYGSSLEVEDMVRLGDLEELPHVISTLLDGVLEEVKSEWDVVSQFFKKKGGCLTTQLLDLYRASGITM